MNRRPLILAVETSSRLGSVALASGADLLGESTFSATLRHSAEILPAIADLLDQFGHTPSDIRQVHISIGPGSFTGLRIAVAAAKAMHLANATEIVTVGSLDAIAANVTDAPTQPVIQNTAENRPAVNRLAALLDAKRGQFYVAVYERTAPEAATGPEAESPAYSIPAPGKGCWQKTLFDRLMSASQFLDTFTAETEPIYLAGDGLLHHQGQFKDDRVRILDRTLWSPRAEKVHALGWQKAQAGRFSDPLTLTPFYLRGPQVTLRKGR